MKADGWTVTRRCRTELYSLLGGEGAGSWSSSSLRVFPPLGGRATRDLRNSIFINSCCEAKGIVSPTTILHR